MIGENSISPECLPPTPLPDTHLHSPGLSKVGDIHVYAASFCLQVPWRTIRLKKIKECSVIKGAAGVV